MASVSTAAKGPRQRELSFAVSIDHQVYLLKPLEIDPSIGYRAWRFEKQAGDGEVYDLHLDAFGLQCQCRGFVAHGHCKHGETLMAASRLFSLAPDHSRPHYRSLGDMARNAPEVYADDRPASEPWDEADIDGFAAANGQASA